jgi:hypothetical protein
MRSLGWLRIELMVASEGSRLKPWRVPISLQTVGEAHWSVAKIPSEVAK